MKRLIFKSHNLFFILLICISSGNKALAQKSFSETTISEKVEKLLMSMTLKEKVNMLHNNSSFTSSGVPRLGIPELVTSDGPHGVRLEHGRGWATLENINDSGTYLPVGIALASTWNPSLGCKRRYN